MSSELAVPQTTQDRGYLAQAGMTLIPRNLTEAVEYAKILAASGCVPKEYIGKPADILVAIQHGLELGLKPLQALGAIIVLGGRPTLWGDTVLGIVKMSGLLESMLERDPQEALAQQCGECIVTRRGDAPVTRRFSLEDAKRANLIGRGGPMSPWSQYPGRMLQMRARSWALRDAFPDVLKGLQTWEEVTDVEAHVIQEPRRLSVAPPLESGAGDTALRNLKQAAPTVAAGPQRQASASAPAPASTSGTVATGKVQNVTQKEGPNKTGGTWTRYTILFVDSTSYSTFDKPIAETAKSAKESGQEVRIVYTIGQWGNDAKSCEIVQAKEPDDGGPGMFDGEAGAEA